MHIIFALIITILVDFVAGVLVNDIFTSYAEEESPDTTDFGVALIKLIFVLLISTGVTAATIYKVQDTIESPVVQTSIKPVVDTTITIRGPHIDTLYTYTFVKPEE